ncbi:Metabotropic glutamate receptor 8 [Trichinella pseudospiralis]|uniref:Metabotropic glutamate receptor 8 n=1 Tax=Trichinella pseudospiralis TaxID=6337 RepID=A0A0V1EPZ0_TRIPS|nr:Metabotropic glutamate receptor 8 [Trichinella pseudospiralis]
MVNVNCSLIILFFTYGTVFGGNIALEQCASEQLPAEKNAAAIITLILDVRRTLHSHDGPSCGTVSEEGLQIEEIAQWVIKILNQASGTVFGLPVADSFIPGIELGLQVLDTCGIASRAIRLSAEAFSDLQSPKHKCTFNDTRISLGVIVKADDSTMHHLSDFFYQYKKSVIGLGSRSTMLKQKQVFTLQPDIDTIVQTILKTAETMDWKHLWLIYENTDYGNEGKTLLTKMSTQQQSICILGTEQFSHGTNSSENIKLILEKILSRKEDSYLIILFMSRSVALQFLQAAFEEELIVDSRRMKWIMSDGFDESFVDIFDLSKGVIAISDENPYRIPEFLSHWTEADPKEHSKFWYKEFYQHRHKCRLEDDTNPAFYRFGVCKNKKSAINHTDSELFLTPSAVHVVDAIFTYAIALKGAWMAKCRGRPGLCPQLVQMDNQDFIRFMKHVEFSYRKENRSPPSLISRQVSHRKPKSQVAVFQVQSDEQGNLLLKQIFRYDRFRNNRLLQLSAPLFYDNFGKIDMEKKHSMTTNNKSNQCMTFQKRNTCHIIPGDLYIIAIIGIQEKGSYFDYCGQVNVEDSLADVVFFNHALSSLNKKLLPDLKIGSIIVDSCSNAIFAAQQIGTCLSNMEEIIFSEPDNDASISKQPLFVGALIQADGLESAEISHLLSLTLPSLPIVMYGKNVVPGIAPNIINFGTNFQNIADAVFNVIQHFPCHYKQFILARKYAPSVSVIESMAMKNLIGNFKILLTKFGSDFGGISSMNWIEKNANLSVVVLFLEEVELLEFLKIANQSETSSNHIYLIVLDHIWTFEKLRNFSHLKDNMIIFYTDNDANYSLQDNIINEAVDGIFNSKNIWIRQYIESNLNCGKQNEKNEHNAIVASCKNETILYLKKLALQHSIKTNRLLASVDMLVATLHHVVKNNCFDGFTTGNKCSQFLESFLNLKDNKMLNYVTKHYEKISENDMFVLPKKIGIYFQSQLKNEKFQQIGTFSFNSKKFEIIDFSLFKNLSNQASSYCLNGSSEKQHREQSAVQKSEELLTTLLPVTDMSNYLLQSENVKEMHIYPENIVMHIPPRSNGESVLIGVLLPLMGSANCEYLDYNKVKNEDAVYALEALLWARKKVHILYNMDIQFIIFNTCSSVSKTNILLNSFLINTQQFFGEKFGLNYTEDLLVGFINGCSAGSASIASEILSEASIINADIRNNVQTRNSMTLHFSDNLNSYISATLQFLDQFQINFISILHSNDDTAVTFADKFRLIANNYNVCMAYISQVESTQSLNTLIDNLKSVRNAGATVVLVVLEFQKLIAFERALEKQSHGLTFFIILLQNEINAWNSNHFPVLLNSSILLKKQADLPKDFMNHLLQLRYDNNDGNYLWSDFVKKKFNCTTECHNRLPDISDYAMLNADQVLSAINALSALAVGVRKLGSTMCKNQTIVCKELKELPNFGSELLHILQEEPFPAVDDISRKIRIDETRRVNEKLTISTALILGSNETPLLQPIAVYEDEKLILNRIGIEVKNQSVFTSQCLDIHQCKQCWKSMDKLLNSYLRKFSPALEVHTESSDNVEEISSIPEEEAANVEKKTNKQIAESKSFVCIKSTSNIYLMAVIPIHNDGQKRLACGAFSSNQYQRWKAIQWSLERLNYYLLAQTGINLGIIAVDSCSNQAHTIKQLSYLINGDMQLDSCIQGNLSDQVIAAILVPYDQQDTSHEATVDLLTNNGILTFNWDSSFAYSANSMLFSTGLIEQSIVYGLVKFLAKTKWHYVAYIYSKNKNSMRRKHIFSNLANDNGICSEYILYPSHNKHSCGEMTELFDQLKKIQVNGLRGVVLGLSMDKLRCFLDRMERLVASGQFSPNQFTFITALDANYKQAFFRYESVAAGFVVVHPTAVELDEFHQYWKALKHLNVSNDIWWKELLAADDWPERQDEKLLYLANAAYSVGHAIYETKQQLCGSGMTASKKCNNLIMHHSFREAFRENVAKSKFVDESGQMFIFDKDGLATQRVSISLLVMDLDIVQWIEIGRIENDVFDTKQRGNSPFQNYEPMLYLKKLTSKCTNATLCPQCSRCSSLVQSLTCPSVHCKNEFEESTAPAQLDVTTEKIHLPAPNLHYSESKLHWIVHSSNGIYAIALVPVHFPSEELFLCGPLDIFGGFRQALAFMHSMEKLNKQLPKQNQIGLIIIDTCNAKSDLAFSWIHQLSINNRSVQILAVLEAAYSNSNSNELAELMKNLQIPLLTIDPKLEMSKNEWNLQFKFDLNLYAEIACSVVHRLKFITPLVLFEQSNKLHSSIMEKFIYCLESNNFNNAITKIPVNNYRELDAILNGLSNRPTAVFVLFMSSTFISAFKRAIFQQPYNIGQTIVLGYGLERIFTTTSPIKQAEQHSDVVTWLSIELLIENEADISEFLLSKQLNNHNPIPQYWFEEYWQQMFTCRLSNSAIVENFHFHKNCTEKEEINSTALSKNVENDISVWFLMNVVVDGYKKYVDNDCAQVSTAAQPTRLVNCLKNGNRINLLKYLKSSSWNQIAVGNEFSNYKTLDNCKIVLKKIYMDKDQLLTESVALWKQTFTLSINGKLTSSSSSSKDILCKTSVEEDCWKRFDFTVSNLEETNRMNEIWIVIAISLAGLGMTVCLITSIVLIVTDHASNDMFNHLTLFGLFNLYAVTLAFTWQLSDIVCTIRLYATGFAWILVFAPLSVKVVQMRLFPENGKKQAYCWKKRNCIMVILALVFVHAIIVAQWMIVSKSTKIPVMFKHAKCAPVGSLATFELSLTFSMAYPILIILATMITAMTTTTDMSKHNKSSCGIAVTCMLTIIIWLFWNITSTMEIFQLSDPVIAMGILINASVLFVGLRLRDNKNTSTQSRRSYNVNMTRNEASLQPDLSLVPYGVNFSKSKLGTFDSDQSYSTYSTVPKTKRYFNVMAYDGSSEFSATTMVN